MSATKSPSLDRPFNINTKCTAYVFAEGFNTKVVKNKLFAKPTELFNIGTSKYMHN